MYDVSSARSADRDIRKIHADLSKRVQTGKVSNDFPDRFFEEVEDAVAGLQNFPERHPYAPERYAWRREVRNVLLDSGYRILFQVYSGTIWVMRVRHQRQKQLKTPGPGSALPPLVGNL